MRIQHNIMAMNAYRNYNTNTSALSKNLEKLSSGYKINRAGDDAAGLAISEKMRAQITGLEAAQKNVKDGVSLVKTAEGAMQEIQDMLNRMDYLATQSANGTYQDEVDRENLQLEVEQLRSEINRIADSANFNGIKLLDGSLDSTGMSKALAAAEAAQKTADDAMAAANEAQGEIVFGAETKATLPNQATNNTPATGTGATDRANETILETDYKEAPAVGFSVNFDSMTHVFKNVTDNTSTANDAANVTISIDGKATTFSEKDLSDYIVAQGNDAPKNGDTVDSETLAAFVAEKIGAEFTDAANNKYDVSVNGSTIRFDAQNANQTTIPSFSVGLNGVTETTVAATKGSYTTKAYTAGSDANGDVTFEVKATLEDGTEATFTVGTDAGLKSNSTITDVVNALKKAKATVNGDEVELGQYFNVSADTGAVKFEAKQRGADKGKITGFTLSDTNATEANKAKFAAGDPTVVEGAETYNAGTMGYLNSKTEVNVAPGTVKKDQLASTVITLTANDVKDGKAIRLGDQTYVFAVGENSAYKDAENAVYVDGLKDTDTNFLAKMSAKLTEVAANNKTFTVGSGKTAGEIGLKQLGSVKDSTDMSTMDKLGSYIGLTSVDEAATKASKDAAVEAAKADAAKLQETADKLKADADKLVEGKDLTLQIGDTSDSFNQLGVSVGNMHTYAMGSEGKSIADIDVGTQTGAQEAVQVVKDAINYVSSVRGTLGATQNRLEHTANNLSVMAENIQDAESTIRDTDVAEEMMSYVKNNILVQSAQAMLAQANQVPQGVLQLLG